MLGKRLHKLYGVDFKSSNLGVFARHGHQTSSKTSSPETDKENPTFKPRFAFAKHGDFTQPEPQHQNSWQADSFLQSYLKLNLPDEVFQQISPDLNSFGERCAGEIWDLGRECEENPPYLRQTNAWGRRIDEIVTCHAWKKQKSISAEEGLIAIPYENRQGEYSRLYQCAKLFMYSPSSGLYSCPLAMTDGAAKTIKGLNLSLPEAWENLTSREPQKFWTAGQWMTERRGGSDVGASTETTAIHKGGSSYNLYGYKWFSSATDSNMALTLARTIDHEGSLMPGSKGLSMYYLKTRRDDGSLNNIQVVKLKNKLGTRQLPTAELLLDGTEAELVSVEGRGIPSISSMLTITRLHNVISSVAAMRKIISLARDYSTRRTAFRTTIDQLPLHIQTLARMEVEVRGCSVLMLDLSRQMGLHDNNAISDQDLLLMRLMTPVAKLYTGKMAVSTVSEGLECFGGQGYIEDTGIPGILRDVQVLPIWEGTSNVMSLDVLRAVLKTKGEVLEAFRSRMSEICTKAEKHSGLKECGGKLMKTVNQILTTVGSDPEILQFCARDFTTSLAHTYIAGLLMDHALRSGEAADVDVVEGWMARELAPVLRNPKLYNKEQTQRQRALVFQNYTITHS